MRILVFDDSEINRAAAQAQLKLHDLTVVGTYDEAQELLTPQFDYEKANKELEREFGDFKPWRSDDEAMIAHYDATKKIVIEKATTYPDFDVVLTDLLVPASSQAQGRTSLVGKEMPVGIFIGLLAAVRARAKYVAVFTDIDHHSHPASACFDVFNYKRGESEPTAFMIGDCKILLSNTRNWVGKFDPNDLGKALKYEEYTKRSDTISAKNWAVLLAYLLA